MNTFTYRRANETAEALHLGALGGAKYLGGGTNLVDLMRETLERPASLVDVTGLSTTIAETPEGGLRIGAGVRNSAVAEHSAVRERYPVLARRPDSQHGHRGWEPPAAHPLHVLLR